jgi:ATP-dependent Clp endopeptidase proteolytic subunit ClpP
MSENEEEIGELEGPDAIVFQEEDDETSPALVGLCGEINEFSLKEVVLALLAFNKSRIIHDADTSFEDCTDIEFFISSTGGCVNDMFAIYDLMSLVKTNRDIGTFGYGKVASAAVLLMAAGTRGKRHIAKNARVMLHHCSANVSGTQPHVHTSYAELKKVEGMMVEALAENSSLSVGEIYNIFSRNTDEFFSAEEVLEMGLVDKII